MSRRADRLLLKLYPARFRRRYGAEIRDLSHELRAQRDISRLRLLRDLVLSALAVRFPLRRSQLTVTAGIAAIVIAGLLGAGTIAVSSHAHRAITAAQRTRGDHALTAQAVHSGSCLIDAGTACSLMACTQFIGQVSAVAAVARAEGPGTRPRCVSNPRQQQVRPVYVGG